MQVAEISSQYNQANFQTNTPPLNPRCSPPGVNHLHRFPRVCVYYCSTYYKAVRVGEGDSPHFARSGHLGVTVTKDGQLGGHLSGPTQFLVQKFLGSGPTLNKKPQTYHLPKKEHKKISFHIFLPVRAHLQNYYLRPLLLETITTRDPVAWSIQTRSFPSHAAGGPHDAPTLVAK
jgi:hypothetical protein